MWKLSFRGVVLLGGFLASVGVWLLLILAAVALSGCAPIQRPTTDNIDRWVP